jgi:adenosylcobinamide-GDP ribazoletransferase
VQTLLAAFKYLTVWGCFAATQPAPETVGRAAAYFPIVGLLLGLLLALSNYILAPHLDPQIVTAVVIALWLVATGGRHLHGLKETFDELGTRSEGNRPTNETIGFAAIVLVFLLKSAAVNSMDELLGLSLLLSPLLARWALVIFLYGYNTRFVEIVRLVSERVKFWPLFTSTAATLALAVYFLGRKGLWIALILSLFTLLMRGLLYRRHAVLSQANLGVTVELTEALSLVLLASL